MLCSLWILNVLSVSCQSNNLSTIPVFWIVGIYVMINIILAEHDVAIPTFREMFQQDTNRDFQNATIHFSSKNIVRAIANFKLLIATIKIFICTCRPYNVQIRILAYWYFFECRPDPSHCLRLWNPYLKSSVPVQCAYIQRL